MCMLKPSLVFGNNPLKTCVSSSELLLFYAYSFMAVRCIILATLDFQKKRVYLGFLLNFKMFLKKNIEAELLKEALLNLFSIS